MNEHPKRWWHAVFSEESVRTYYRQKARAEARPAVCMDTFLLPGLRGERPAGEAPPPDRPDALKEVVAGIVEGLLPALVPRLVELLLPLLEKRLSVQAARLVLMQIGNGHERQGRS